MKNLLLLLLLPLALIVGAYVVISGGDSEPQTRTISVRRGTVVREAVAVGRIEPRFEVPVVSRNGGVLRTAFVELGQRVEREDPLVEVRPVVTDLDMLGAERALESAQEAEEQVGEFRQGDNLMGRAMLFLQGRKNLDRMRRSAERQRSNAEEQLLLLREGSAEIEGKEIDYVVRAPIAGHVIDLPSEVGQPVVAASNFGSGTTLLVLADMDDPVFRGTVNEVDVGRLKTGMRGTLDIGALPDVPANGELTEISLRSRSVNNATVFNVELSVAAPEGVVLRSGYSAVARIELARVDDVLVLPERVVDYRDGTAFVRVPAADGTSREVEVTAGLSDGLTVEVQGGLSEGDTVLER